MFKMLVLTSGLLLALGGAAAPRSPMLQEAPAADPAVLALLPEGPGRETTALVCSQCHSIGMVTSQRHDQNGWNEVIARMANDQGLTASETELLEISAYLSEHFAPEPPAAASAKP